MKNNQNARRDALCKIGGTLMAGAFGGLSAEVTCAQTAAWPQRPVRLVYPFNPGGLGDSMARTIGNALSQTWGQPVVVENRPGAGGLIGSDIVAKAEPDGHTLLFAFTALVQVPTLMKKVLFNPIRDFTPITELATTHVVLAVNPELPVHSVRELVEFVKRQDKPFPYGTYGIGSTGHLLVEILAKQTGMKVTSVAYKGEMPLLADMLGGQVSLGFLSATTAQQHIKAGKLRGLAVAGDSRSPLLPDLPNFGEAGYPQVEGSGWIGMFAPARTPKPIVEKIAADVAKVLAIPEFRSKWAESGLIVRGTSPAVFAEAVRKQYDYWGNAIRSTGIQLD